jgi:hypothetical protein
VTPWPRGVDDQNAYAGVEGNAVGSMAAALALKLILASSTSVRSSLTVGSLQGPAQYDLASDSVYIDVEGACCQVSFVLVSKTVPFEIV